MLERTLDPAFDGAGRAVERTDGVVWRAPYFVVRPPTERTEPPTGRGAARVGVLTVERGLLETDRRDDDPVDDRDDEGVLPREVG